MRPKDFRVEPGSKVHLDDFNADDTGEYKGPEQVEAKLNEKLVRIAKLQERLYAESRRAVLIVLQGMDTSGKDGTTKSVLREVNPQGVNVVSFKAPSKEELAHDFLWRAHRVVPPKGTRVFVAGHWRSGVWVVGRWR